MNRQEVWDEQKHRATFYLNSVIAAAKRLGLAAGEAEEWTDEAGPSMSILLAVPSEAAGGPRQRGTRAIISISVALRHAPNDGVAWMLTIGLPPTEWHGEPAYSDEDVQGTFDEMVGEYSPEGVARLVAEKASAFV